MKAWPSTNKGCESAFPVGLRQVIELALVFWIYCNELHARPVPAREWKSLVAPIPSWRRLERQRAVCALFFAFDRAGNNRLAKMAMTAMTTSNSTRVKAGSILGVPRTVAGRFDFFVFMLYLVIGQEWNDPRNSNQQRILPQGL